MDLEFQGLPTTSPEPFDLSDEIFLLRPSAMKRRTPPMMLFVAAVGTTTLSADLKEERLIIGLLRWQ